MPKLSQPEKLVIAAEHRVLQAMLDNHLVRSCLNCEAWADDQCTLYKSVPPPKVIMFSCGDGWVADIPF